MLYPEKLGLKLQKNAPEGYYRQLANNPNSAELRLAYQNSKANSDYMQVSLLNQWLKERNFTEVEAILALDETKEGLRNIIGYKMMRKDYTTATTLLNAYTVEDAEDQQFKELQELNLMRLQQGTSFSMTEQQQDFLESMADNEDAPFRSYAEALRCYLAGEHYALNLPVDAPTQGLIQNDFNNNYTESFTVYPNPSTGRFTLVYPEHLLVEEALKCQLKSMNGQLIQQIELKDSGKQELDFSSLAEGVYFLELSNESIGIQQQRIVIIK